MFIIVAFVVIPRAAFVFSPPIIADLRGVLFYFSFPVSRCPFRNEENRDDFCGSLEASRSVMFILSSCSSRTVFRTLRNCFVRDRLRDEEGGEEKRRRSIHGKSLYYICVRLGICVRAYSYTRLCVDVMFRYRAGGEIVRQQFTAQR